MSTSPLPQERDDPKGFAFALTAYLIWGFLPLYMKALSHIPTLEVLAHRVIWAVPVALLVLIWLRRTDDLKTAFRSPRLMGMAALCAVLISINWGTYVYAIQSGQSMEAAIGYYINPLFSVLIGWLFLGEKLKPIQWVAVGLAAAAVLVLTLGTGRLPLITIVMSLSWAAYAFLKKWLPLGPNQGFTLEVLLLLPLAGGYWLWLMATGQSAMQSGSALDIWLLLGCGVITAVPLMVYANGAKLLRLSTIGLLQYVTPTMIFLTAVFLFGEPFGMAQAIAFPLIWGGLILYTLGALRK